MDPRKEQVQENVQKRVDEVSGETQNGCHTPPTVLP
jgi:hypothetical protein